MLDACPAAFLHAGSSYIYYVDVIFFEKNAHF